MTSLDLEIIEKETKERTFTYTWKDVGLYNMGIGAQPDELSFVMKHIFLIHKGKKMMC